MSTRNLKENSKSRDSDDHLVLRDVHAKRAMEPVPTGRYGAKVRVVLPLDLRVVDAVHARSDEHLIEPAFIFLPREALSQEIRRTIP